MPQVLHRSVRLWLPYSGAMGNRAEKVVRLGVVREPGWLYFLRGTNLLRTREREGIDFDRVRGEVGAP